jgi:hypothetical protein
MNIGANFMPGIQYESDYFSNKIFKLSYSTGLKIRLVYYNAFDLSGGIQYSVIWDQSKLSPYRNWTDGYGPDPFPNDSLITNLQYGHAFYFIDIPILLSYRFSSHKVKYSINGCIFSHILREKEVILAEHSNNQSSVTENNLTLEHYKSIQLAPTISF